MKTSEIEQAITTKIETFITDLKVEATSGGNTERRRKTSKGAVFVHYYGSNYSDSMYDKDSVILQDRTLFFDLFLTVRGTSDNNDGQDYLDTIRENLTGWQINNKFSKVMPVTEVFLDKVEHDWHYKARYKFDTKNAEASIAHGF